MNAADMKEYIIQTFEGVRVVDDQGNSFFSYNPDPDVPPDYRFQFATLVTSNVYDQFSDLDRPSAFRLSLGVSKQTFRSLFGGPEASSDHVDADESSSYDYKALNQVTPHPEYGKMHWISVLSPSDEMFETTVRPLLVEAYERVVTQFNKSASRK